MTQFTDLRHMSARRALCIGLILFVIDLNGQTPGCIEVRRDLSDASMLHANGEHAAALDHWDKALPQCAYALWYWIEATEAALVFGDTIRAARYLTNVYAQGGQPLVNYSDPIKALFAHGVPAPLMEAIQNAKLEWASKADSVWIVALQEMYALDQSHRADDALTRRNDSLNLERLIHLTETRSFPAPARTGSSYGIVNLLLWHHRGELGMNERLVHYVGLVQKAMDACEIEPDFLTGLLDYEAWENGEPMPFGVLIGYFRDKLDGIHLPTLEEIDANRASVGLGLLEYQARSQGLSMDSLPFGR